MTNQRGNSKRIKLNGQWVATSLRSSATDFFRSARPRQSPFPSYAKPWYADRPRRHNIAYKFFARNRQRGGGRGRKLVYEFGSSSGLSIVEGADMRPAAESESAAPKRLSKRYGFRLLNATVISSLPLARGPHHRAANTNSILAQDFTNTVPVVAASTPRLISPTITTQEMVMPEIGYNAPRLPDPVEYEPPVINKTARSIDESHKKWIEELNRSLREGEDLPTAQDLVVSDVFA